MGKNYESLNIKEEIIYKLDGIDRTRQNRIGFSERLKKYNTGWKFVFSILNFEAIFLIIMSLQSIGNNRLFSIFSSAFSIYVILLQYFINELNYNERSLKAHYHQLELEDQRLKLKRLLLEINEGTKNDSDINEQIDEYKEIMDDYQLMLKNNENHSKIDDIKMSRQDETKAKKNGENKDEKTKGKKLKKSLINCIRSKDFSIDNIFLWANFFVGIFIAILLTIFLFKGNL